MTDEVIQADSEKMTNVSITEDGTRINNVRHSTIDRVNGILTANELPVLVIFVFCLAKLGRKKEKEFFQKQAFNQGIQGKTSFGG